LQELQDAEIAATDRCAAEPYAAEQAGLTELEVAFPAEQTLLELGLADAVVQRRLIETGLETTLASELVREVRALTELRFSETLELAPDIRETL